jgi:hypothetical protein
MHAALKRVEAIRSRGNLVTNTADSPN